LLDKQRETREKKINIKYNCYKNKIRLKNRILIYLRIYRMTDFNVVKEFKKAFPGSRLGTKKFEKYNQKVVRQGLTEEIAYSNGIIYNQDTNRFVNKSKYFKNNGGVRSRFNNDDFNFQGDTLSRPSIYVENEIRPLIIQAEQTKESVKIPFDLEKMNDNVDFLLKKISPTTSMNYFIQTGDTFYALNNSTIKSLREALKTDFMFDTGYDSELAVLAGMKGAQGGTLNIRSPSTKAVNGGSFFRYTHKLIDPIQKKKINLDKYGVFHEVKAENYEVNCLCNSFLASGLDITQIKHLVRNQEIPMRLLGDVANKLGVYITVRKIEDKSNLKHYGDKTKRRIELGLIDKHYFLIEKIPYTSYSIKNFDKIKDIEKFNTIWTYDEKVARYKKKKGKEITSYQAIKILLENKETHLTEIEHCGELYKTNYHTTIDDVFKDLSFNDNIHNFNFKTGELTEGDLKINKPSKPFDNECLDTYYFDFETSTRRSDKTATIHKPYCVFTQKHRGGFFGEDCGKKLLDDILKQHGTSVDEVIDDDDEDKKSTPFVRLIAHNSSYDFRFILKYLVRLDTIEKGTGLMNCNARYYNYGKYVDIQIRDSLKMINMGLAKFGGAFGLDIKKEILPYDLYTEENVEKVWIPIEECIEEVKIAGYDVDVYLKNCEEWDCISNGLINILKYSGEYCYLDCIVLQQGYEKFGSLVEEAIGEDISNYISLASMAHNHLVKEGCYDNVLQVSGVPRAFIQKCVVGGRTMCSGNKKSLNFEKYSHKKFSDFDAVSLYPSGMARMRGFLKGKPKIIETFEPEKYDGYFICIKVKSINKKYKFPCVSLLDDKGIRQFKNNLEGEYLYLDRVGLEDFVKYHGAEYEFVNGYYYDDGHNHKIRSVMTHLFNQRLKFKKEGNPIQMVFKELMNSSYGKSYEKPRDSDSKYVPAKEFDTYMDRNFNYVKEATKLANGLYYKVKFYKAIDSHFNNAHVGVEILSMSKRIMFEVMTLAEDLGHTMTYTDTDSIHIDSSKIDELATEFKKKYGRELIGKGMGQFHTDFDLKGSVGDIHATESIFLGKKCYVDKLQGYDKDGNEVNDYHIRMKGVPSDCIIYKAQQEYGGDIIALYKDLYDGKELTFNLLAVRPKFEMCKNMNIITKTKFDRKISF
tara:strand:- start:155 stop:3589 length:3435 start_codon:yes stop_codon:yes gene_type:complete